MMNYSSIWALIYYIIIVKGLFIVILVMPLPSNTWRKYLIKVVDTLENNNTWHHFRILISILVTVLFFTSITAINRIEKSENVDWSDDMNELWENNQLLRNQRNVWICGICFLL